MRNLELLSKAFPLRVWQVGVDEGQETPSPILDLCVPAARPQLQEWVKGEPEGMPETSVHFLRRFLNGVQCIQPRVAMIGEPWPILLSGKDGFFASLYLSAGLGGSACPLFAWVDESGDTRQMELVDDESVDLAIDVLMREQWVSPEAAAIAG